MTYLRGPIQVVDRKSKSSEMGASSVVRGVVDHFSILVRQTDMSDNNDPDRWNIGSQPVNSNAITTTNYRWVSIVDEVILVSDFQ